MNETMWSRVQCELEQNGNKYREDFPAWLSQNVGIFEAAVMNARMAQRRGFKHYSIYTIIEFLRFHTSLREGPQFEFKINNNYRADLARLIEATCPDLSGFFTMRERPLLRDQPIRRGKPEDVMMQGAA